MTAKSLQKFFFFAIWHNKDAGRNFPHCFDKIQLSKNHVWFCQSHGIHLLKIWQLLLPQQPYLIAKAVFAWNSILFLKKLSSFKQKTAVNFSCLRMNALLLFPLLTIIRTMQKFWLNKQFSFRRVIAV